MTVHVPEQPQDARESRRELVLAVVEQPVEASAEVVVIVLQPLQPGWLVGALEGGLGLFGQVQEVIGMPASDRFGLA